MSTSRDYIIIGKDLYKFNKITLLWDKCFFNKGQKMPNVKNVTNKIGNRLIFKNGNQMLDIDNMRIHKIRKEDYVTEKSDMILYDFGKELTKKFGYVESLLKKILSETSVSILENIIINILFKNEKKMYVILNSNASQIYDFIKECINGFYDEVYIRDYDIIRYSVGLNKKTTNIGEINDEKDIKMYNDIYNNSDRHLILYNTIGDLTAGKKRIPPDAIVLDLKKKAAYITYNMEEFRNVFLSVLVHLAVKKDL